MKFFKATAWRHFGKDKLGKPVKATAWRNYGRDKIILKSVKPTAWRHFGIVPTAPGTGNFLLQPMEGFFYIAVTGPNLIVIPKLFLAVLLFLRRVSTPSPVCKQDSPFYEAILSGEYPIYAPWFLSPRTELMLNKE